MQYEIVNNNYALCAFTTYSIIIDNIIIVNSNDMKYEYKKIIIKNIYLFTILETTVKEALELQVLLIKKIFC